METTRMDLLVTLDEHYLPQLRVMLTSLRLSHPGVQCRVYLLHRSIPEERLDESVYRVLSLKAVYGLSNAPVEAPDIEALNDRIAALERSIEADTSQ